jgi:hypothetical protein
MENNQQQNEFNQPESSQGASQEKLSDYFIDSSYTVSNIKVETSSSQGEASEYVCKKVLDDISRDKRGPKFDVAVAASHLCQGGATSPKSPDDKKVFVNNISLSNRELKTSCKKNGVTVRQFARGFKDGIIDNMMVLGWEFASPGNLSKQIQIDIPNLSKEELLWASDFQTYNERCPERVREWLLKNYKNRFQKGTD